MSKILLLLIPMLILANSAAAESEATPEKAPEQGATEIRKGVGTNKAQEKERGEAKAYIPKAGSPERKMILDAVRKDLHIDHQFEVLHLKVKNGVAYFSGNAMGSVKGVKRRVEKVKALIEKQSDGSWIVSDIWILDKGNKNAGAKEQKAFNERIQKRLREEPGLENIFTEKT